MFLDQVFLTQDQIDKLLEFTHFHTKNYDESHDIQHHIRVGYNFMDIYDNLPSNKVGGVKFSLGLVSCLVHDVIDHKYLDLGTATEKDIYNIIKEVFQMNIDTKKLAGYYAEGCLAIINNMSYSKEIREGIPDLGELTVTRNLVAEADRLDSLGENGIQRCFNYTKKFNPEFTNKEIINEMKNHFQEKLLILKDAFYTEWGKSEAERRTIPLQEWYVSH